MSFDADPVQNKKYQCIRNKKKKNFGYVLENIAF